MKTIITKRMMSIVLASVFFSSSVIAQQLLMEEDFQNWTSIASYSSGSQEITSGTVYYENLIIKNDYPSISSRTVNATCSPGYIQIKEGSLITLPQFSENISKIEIHAYSGTKDNRTFQILANESALQTCTIKGSASDGETGEKIEIPVNSITPIIISIGHATGTIYISDIKVYATITTESRNTISNEIQITHERYYSLDGLELTQEHLVKGKMYIKSSLYQDGRIKSIKFIK